MTPLKIGLLIALAMMISVLSTYMLLRKNNASGIPSSNSSTNELSTVRLASTKDLPRTPDYVPINDSNSDTLGTSNTTRDKSPDEEVVNNETETSIDYESTEISAVGTSSTTRDKSPDEEVVNNETETSIDYESTEISPVGTSMQNLESELDYRLNVNSVDYDANIIMSRSSGKISQLFQSNNGKYVAEFTYEGILRVRNVDTGEIRVLLGYNDHTFEITNLRFTNKDSKIVISYGNTSDSMVSNYDIRSDPVKYMHIHLNDFGKILFTYRKTSDGADIKFMEL